MNDKNSKLIGIPKLWRELLEMPVQENELEEIDETLEINKRKMVTKQMEKAAMESNMEFEIVEVVPP